MKPMPELPELPSDVPRRIEHDTSRGLQQRAGERSGQGSYGLRPYLEQERRNRGVPGSQGLS